MLAPLIVFVIVMAIVLGAYFLMIVRPEEQFLTRLKPVRSVSEAAKRRLALLKPGEQTSSTVELEKRIPALTSLSELLTQSGVNINLAGFLLLSAVIAVSAYFVTWLVVRMSLVSLLVAVLAGLIPYAVVRRARTKRMLKFEEHFPEAINLISRALRAGHALPTGLRMVADEMPAPISTEFRILYDEQNFGLTLENALRNFAARIPVLDARFFVTAVLTQREAGGNLAEVLDNLAAVIRARFKVKRQIRVISAHGRITGTVLAFLPPSLAAITLLLNREYLGTLMGDPLGHQMIAAALILQTVGVLIMRRIINVEY